MNYFKRVREVLTFMKQKQGTIQKWEYWNKFSVLAKAKELAQNVSSFLQNQPGELQGQLVETSIASSCPP